MSVKPHPEARNYYTPSIRFFQEDGKNYFERTEGDNKVTLIVDRTKLTRKEDHLYHLFQMKCINRNLEEMRERYEKDCEGRSERFNQIADSAMRIADTAIDLNTRLTAVEVDQIRLKHAFAQESARRGMEVPPWLLERRLAPSQPIPEGVPR